MRKKPHSAIKKVMSLLGLILIGVASALTYYNAHLFNKAERIRDELERTKILEKAKLFYPWNDLVFYELGKTYFTLFQKTLSDEKKSRAYLLDSTENFRHSLKINPTSPFAHLYYGQSLIYADLISLQQDNRYFDTFKKAVNLGGQNTQIDYEVGRLFLSRWQQIPQEDRESTISLLKGALSSSDLEKFRSLMFIWEMNIRDYGVMRRIIPDEPKMHYMYARFLGEKSLSQEERHNILTRAEVLDMENARMRSSIGKRFMFDYRFREARGQFRICLDILKRIKGYQKFTEKKPVNQAELKSLRKTAFLNRATCILEEGGEWTEAEKDLKCYLELEESLAEVKKLESYLLSREVLTENLEQGLKDLRRLSFQLFFYFKLNRYSEITKLGPRLLRDFVAVPERNKDCWVSILHIVGDSFQRSGYMYDASKYYLEALETDPSRVDTLVRLRQNYKNLREEDKLQDIDTRIREHTSPKEIRFESLEIKKGRSFSRTLILDGRDIELDVYFSNGQADRPRLVSVFFNGTCVWDGFLDSTSRENPLSLSMISAVGENFLRIEAVNSDLHLDKLRYRLGNNSDHL